MSVDFQGTKFFLALGLILIASVFVFFKVAGADFREWCFFTTGIFSVYCGMAVVSRSKFMKK